MVFELLGILVIKIEHISSKEKLKKREVISKHYENRSIQYTAIFHSCKNDNFQMKNFDIFLILTQNIDCWYTLEKPHCGGSNE